MKTGIYIRAQVNGEWKSVDIGARELSNQQLMDWLRAHGGENPTAENVVGILLGRGNIATQYRKGT